MFASETSTSDHIHNPQHLCESVALADGAKFWFHAMRNCFITGGLEDIEGLRSRRRLAAHAGSDPAGVRETDREAPRGESRVSIVVIAHRGGRRGPEDFASRLDAESAYVMEQFKPGSNRPGLLDRLEHTPALPSPYQGETGKKVRLNNVFDITTC